MLHLRKFWSAPLCEEFSDGGMIVGNIDNALDGVPKIVTGSLQGTLRVHNPELRDSDAESTRVTSLLLEVQLEAPVLHLKLGRLLPDESGRLGLAVLHPQRLAVYKIEVCQVKTPQLDQKSTKPGSDMGTARVPRRHALVSQYSHCLSRNGKEFEAFNLCVGPFGRTNEHHDSIIVQSLQCCISMFDQNAEVFSRQLHEEFVLPGPLEYVTSCNGFATQNTSFEVELYECGALIGDVEHDSSCSSLCNGSCHRNHPMSPCGSSKSATMIVPRWSIDIGELAMYMLVGTISATKEDTRPSEGIICIGERNIFMLSPVSGALLARAGLDYEAVSPCMYNPDRFVSSSTKRRGDFVIVGETNGNVHFLTTPCTTKSVARPSFEDSSAPLMLAVFDMPTHPGMIVMLVDFGRLSLAYLGNQRTTGILSSKKGLSNDDVNVACVEAELNNLDVLLIPAAKSSSPGVDCNDRIECSSRCNADTVVVITEVMTPMMFRYAPNPRSMDIGRYRSSDVHAATVPWVLRCESEKTAKATAHRQGSPHAPATSGYAVALRVTENLIELATRIHTPEWTYCAVGGTSHPGICSAFVESRLYTRTCLSPTSMEAMVTASYTGMQYTRRAATTAFRLPMGLTSYVLKPSTQETNLKLIIDTNREAVSLNVLFDDLLQRDSGGVITTTPVISFMFCFADGEGAFRQLPGIQSPVPRSSTSAPSGPMHQRSEDEDINDSTEKPATASILVAKRGRYHLHAAVIPAMWLVADELCRRLTEHWSGAIKLAFNGEVQLSDLAALVDAYHDARTRLQAARVNLCDSSLGLQNLEVRFLTRSKDVLASSFESACSALKCKYLALTEGVNDVSCVQQECDRIARTLAASLRLILLRLRFKFSFTEEQADTLNLYFHPDVFTYNLTAAHDPGAGWEEFVEASLCFLLRAFSTQPGARRELLSFIDWNPWSPESDREVFLLAHVEHTTLSFPTSTENLKRYIALVISIMPTVKLQLVALGCRHFSGV